MTLPKMPTISPPINAPATLSSPPSMTTAIAGKSSCDNVQSTLCTEPQTTPAATAVSPAIPQDTPIARSTEMPTDQLETWSSETARKRVPVRVRKKKVRSEERRVGKECKTRDWPKQAKERIA